MSADFTSEVCGTSWRVYDRKGVCIDWNVADSPAAAEREAQAAIREARDSGWGG